MPLSPYLNNFLGVTFHNFIHIANVNQFILFDHCYIIICCRKILGKKGWVPLKVTIDLDADLFQLLKSIQSKSIQEGKVPANFSEIINNLLLKLIKKYRIS